MKTKTWIGIILFIALVSVALAALVACQNKSEAGPSKEEEVSFSSPCSDIIDPWTPMSQDERLEACQEMLIEKAEELQKLDFAPQDCQVTEAKVKDCGIGTELSCIYACSEDAER